MSPVDLTIVVLYLAAMLAVGAYFARRQRGVDEYFVGGRKMGAGHVGFSVVATDVGGGFSIGLGGLGFTMGLSASWLLFTGLVGAWLSAVVLIPRIKPLADRHGWLTYPDYLAHRFDGRTRTLAAAVSALGYAGFVGAQILAGAKLASAAFDIDQVTAVWVIAVVVVVYTAMGGIEAVIYTDTVQWIIVMVGLLLVALPLGWIEVGGLAGLKAALPPDHLRLTAIEPSRVLIWGVTIIPIWFVAMTLYQRIYATRDERTARRAWYLAGLLEYPLIAFSGTALGMFARVLYPEVEPETGLPLLIREILPMGAMGLVLAAYFSAIMSTADSCLLASVGNLVGDLYRPRRPRASDRELLWLGRGLSVGVGFASVALALLLPRVLDIILLSYGFMVSGLFVPTLAGLLWKRVGRRAAFASMAVGGGASVFLSLSPDWAPLEEPTLVAIPLSLVTLLIGVVAEGRKTG